MGLQCEGVHSVPVVGMGDGGVADKCVAGPPTAGGYTVLLVLASGDRVLLNSVQIGCAAFCPARGECETWGRGVGECEVAYGVGVSWFTE